MLGDFSGRARFTQAQATLAFANVEDVDVKERRVASLRLLQAECDNKQVLLAERIKKSAPQISQWYGGSRTISEESAREIERNAKLPPGWMDLDHSEPQAGGDAVALALDPRVAQSLSQQARIFHAQRVTWEQVVQGITLGELFIMAVPDDANSPDFPRGTELVWSTSKAPQFGSMILVRDKHGQMHLRQYFQGDAPGAWTAEALNKAFKSFNGADGLQIVAVAAYRAMP